MGGPEEQSWDGVDMGAGTLLVVCCPSSIAAGQVALGRVGAAWRLEESEIGIKGPAWNPASTAN